MSSQGTPQNGGGKLDWPSQDSLSERQAEIKLQRQQRASEGMIIVTAWIFVSAIGFTFWVAMVWPALPVVHGYPSIGVSPGAPGPFLSQRYTTMWFTVYLLVINYGTAAFLAMAIATPGRISAVFLHYIVTLLSGLINFFVGIWALLINLWYCNSSAATWNAMANDVHWCCVHAHSSTVAGELCGAINPVCTPMVVQMNLTTNPQWTWVIIGAWLFLFFNSFFHLKLNERLKPWGLLNVNR